MTGRMCTATMTNRVKSYDTKYSLINMKNTSTLEKQIDNSY